MEVEEMLHTERTSRILEFEASSNFLYEMGIKRLLRYVANTVDWQHKSPLNPSFLFGTFCNKSRKTRFSFSWPPFDLLGIHMTQFWWTDRSHLLSSFLKGRLKKMSSLHCFFFLFVLNVNVIFKNCAALWQIT